MKQILDLIDNAGGIGSLAKKFGLSDDVVMSAAKSVLPKLGGKLLSNIASADGLSSLVGALTGGDHKKYVEQPDAATSDDAVADGNRILGHVLGSKDESRRVAAEASDESGVEYEVLKAMLPSFAGMYMGSLRKNADAAAPEDKGLADIADTGANSNVDVGGLLSSLIQ